MRRTVPITLGRLVEQIPDGARVFVLGCGDCATRERFGGAAECVETADALAARGVQVAGWSAPAEGEGTCDPRVARATLAGASGALASADVIVLLACPQGEPAVTRATDLPVLVGTQVVMGGATGGNAASVDECNFCDRCIAEAAGGLCPHSFCPKHLINGPCGGAQGGRCEALPRRPCVWELIHRRLKVAGRLDILSVYQEPVSFNAGIGEDEQ
ncbi:MAG: methylenetetrahydrofolate reductase C-terminal domain-containing protein [Armatimonadota bacterium]|jgi:hypothetical protein